MAGFMKPRKLSLHCLFSFQLLLRYFGQLDWFESTTSISVGGTQPRPQGHLRFENDARHFESGEDPGDKVGRNHQSMAKSCLQELTEPAVLALEVAEQHDEFVLAIVSGVFGSSRASLWLDGITRKLVECFNEELPKPELVLSTG